MALARASEGSMRDALSLLDQAIAYGGKAIHHSDLEVLLGAVPQELVQELIRAILAQDSSAALTRLAHLLDQGHDLRAYCAEVVEHLRNLLVAAVVPDTTQLRSLIEAAEDGLNQLPVEAKALTPEQLQELLAIFLQAEDALRFSSHPRFVVETAAIRATRLFRQQHHGIAKPIQATPPPDPKHPSKPVSPAAPPPPERPSTPTGTKPVPQRIPSSKTERGGEQPPSRSLPKSLSNAPPATSANTPTTTVHPQTPLNWESVQEEVNASFPNMAPFLESGRFIGTEGEFITIGFPKQATLARARLEKEENLLALGRLCEQQTGRPVRIRIVELNETHPPGPTMAQIRAAKEQEQRLVLFERAKANPTVKQALEIFGAELAEVRTVAQQEAHE